MRVGTKVKINCRCAACVTQNRTERSATITKVIGGLFFIRAFDVKIPGYESIFRYPAEDISKW